jgi:hypothetical protein
MGGKMPFQSQSQWRWAFANEKPFADKWAKETPTRFSQLPKRKKATTGGNFAAQAGQQIVGNRCRDANGHWAACDEVQGQAQPRNPATSSMAAWNTAMEEQRVIEMEKKRLRKQALLESLGLRKPKGTGSGKISAAERKRQMRAEQKNNEATTHAAVGPGASLGAALSAFADPDRPGMIPNLTAAKLAEYGLVEMGKMGQPYITGEGRAYINAARSGDQFAAREAFQRARESYQSSLEQQQAQAEQEQFDQQITALEGTPQERRLRLAMERYNKRMGQTTGGGSGSSSGSKKPASQRPVTYGSGKVIAGSPKSTVKEYDQDDDMNFFPPNTVLKTMIVGNDIAKHLDIRHELQGFVQKVVSGQPLTIHELRRMKEYHKITSPGSGSREKPTAEWVSYQLLGAAAGYNWIDNVVQLFEHEISRTKSSEDDDDRRPSLSASVESIRGLDLQHYFKRGGSPEMIALGRKIANRDKLTDSEIRTMHAYLVENEKKEHKGDPTNPSVAHINWQIHGADEGLKWTNDAIARIINDTFIETRKEDAIDMKPSQSAASAAMRGLDLQHYFKRGGSTEMTSIARKIANRRELDPEDVRKMHTYLHSHNNDSRDGDPSNPSVSYINWLLYGGEDGMKWANDRIERLRMMRTKPVATMKSGMTYREQPWGTDNYSHPAIAQSRQSSLQSLAASQMNDASQKAKAKINLSPPQGARSAAERGLELRREFNRGGTAIGVARARDLSNGKNMSPRTVRRMNSFFARHAVDKRPNWSDPSKPSNGYIAHLLWGGDAGRSWAGKVSRQLDSQSKKDYPSYVFNSQNDIYRHRNDGVWRAEMARQRRNSVSTSTKGKNKPTDSALWGRAIAEAKKRFRVYPSAYANGWAAKWYKEHGGKWQKESDKSTTKDLRKWFKEEWVDLSKPIRKDGKIVGYEKCGRNDTSKGGYPKCMPKAKAMALSDEERTRLVDRKRQAGMPENGKPTMSSSRLTKKTTTKEFDNWSYGRLVDLRRPNGDGGYMPIDPMPSTFDLEYQKSNPTHMPEHIVSNMSQKQVSSIVFKDMFRKRPATTDTGVVSTIVSK